MRYVLLTLLLAACDASWVQLDDGTNLNLNTRHASLLAAAQLIVVQQTASDTFFIDEVVHFELRVQNGLAYSSGAISLNTSGAEILSGATLNGLRNEEVYVGFDDLGNFTLEFLVTSDNSSFSDLSYIHTQITIVARPCNKCSGHGVCSSIYGCICDASDQQGYWATTETTTPCSACAEGYGGIACNIPCPASFGIICGGHGKCDMTTATCGCYTSVAKGHWSGDSCEDCATDYYGFRCMKECDYNTCVGGQCWVQGEAQRSGVGCVCPEKKQGAQCELCANHRWGPDCEGLCPGQVEHANGTRTACSGHGVCDPDIGTCACQPTFALRDCSYECPVGMFGNVCSGHGTCNDGADGDGTCVCDSGHAMHDCSIIISDNCVTEKAAVVQCNGHGLCNPFDPQTCNCDNGWGGSLCTTQCEGEGNECYGHGVCGDSGCVCTDNRWDVSTDCGTCHANFSGPACLDACPIGPNGQVCSGVGECYSGVCICNSNCGAACELTACAQDTCPDLDSYGPTCSEICSSTCTDPRAVCHSGKTGTGCICQPRYGGPDCLTPCLSGANQLPCSGHGLCSTAEGECDCQPMFSGDVCDIECKCTLLKNTRVTYYPGAPPICRPDGSCDCSLSGFTGEACDIPCPGVYQGEPCSGEGVCELDGGGVAVCRCNSGWAGPLCSECDDKYFGWNCSQLCANGVNDQETCTCDAGWGGDSCELPCTCSVNGVCHAGLGEIPTCECHNGWYGANCSVPCDSNQCAEDRVCNEVGVCDCTGNFEKGGDCVQCDPGWYGGQCELKCPCSDHGRCDKETGTVCDCDLSNGQHWTGQSCEKCEARYLGETCAVYNHEPKHEGEQKSANINAGTGGVVWVDTDKKRVLATGAGMWVVYKPEKDEMLCLDGFGMCDAAAPQDSWTVLIWKLRSDAMGLVTNCDGSHIYRVPTTKYDTCDKGLRGTKVSNNNILTAADLSTGTVYAIEPIGKQSSRLLSMQPGSGSAYTIGDSLLDYEATHLAVRDNPKGASILVVGGVGGSAGWMVQVYDLRPGGLVINLKDTIPECPRCKVDRVYISNDPAEHKTGDLLFISFTNYQGELIVQQLTVNETNGHVEAEEARVKIAGTNWRSTSMHLDPYTGELYVGTKKCTFGQCTEAELVRFTTRDGLTLDGRITLEAVDISRDSAALISLAGFHNLRTLYALHGSGNVTLSKFLMYTVRETDPSGININGGIIAIKGTGFAPVELEDPNTRKCGTNSSTVCVRVGQEEYDGALFSETFIRAQIGPSNRQITGDCEGDVVEVALTGQRFTADKRKIRRYEEPVLLEAVPAYALEDEGGIITLKGSGMVESEYAACRYRDASGSINYYFGREKMPGNELLGYTPNYTLLAVGGDNFAYKTHAAITCRAPVATRDSGIVSVSVTFDGQTFSNSIDFAIVSSRDSLGTYLAETTLTPTDEALFQFPDIEVFTLDINGNRVGLESTETIDVTVDIAFIPDSDVQLANQKCGEPLPNSTCSPLVSNPFGTHGLKVTSGSGVIENLVFACLPLGVINLYASALTEPLKPSPVASVRIIQGVMHTMVFKDIESAPPCVLDKDNVDSFTVVLRFADAAGNVLVKENLAALGANHLPVNAIMYQKSKLADVLEQQYQENLDLNSGNTVTFPAINLEARQGVEYYMLFSTTWLGKYFELRSGNIMARDCYTYSGDYYGIEGEVGCLLCPANANCTVDPSSDVLVGTILPNPGYWAYPNSTRMYKCDSDEVCVGGATPCPEHSYGPLCSLCSDGYGKSGDGTCTECDITAGKIAMIVFLVLLGFMLFSGYSLYTLQQGISSEKSIIVRMLFSHIQILSNLLVLNIPWDRCVTYTFFYGMLVGSDSSNMNIAQVSFVDCVFSKMNFYLLMMASPAVFLPVSVFVYALAQGITWWKSRGKRMRMPQDWIQKEDQHEEGQEKDSNTLSEFPYSNVVIIVCVVIFFMLYQMLAKQSSQLLSCTTLHQVTNDGTKTYNVMTVDMTVDCNGERFSRIKVMATLFLLGYGLGVPLILCWSIDAYRRHHSEEATQRVFTFLVGGFKGGVFKFWQAVIMLRKFCITLVLAFLTGSKVGEEGLAVGEERTRVYVVIWVMIVFILFQVHYNPYKDPAHNAAEAAGQAVLIVTLNLGLLFFLHPDFDKDTDSRFTFAFEVIQVLIILLNLAQFGGFAYLWVKAAETDIRREIGAGDDEGLGDVVKKAVVGKLASAGIVNEDKEKEKEKEKAAEAARAEEEAAAEMEEVEELPVQKTLEEQIKELEEAERAYEASLRVVDVDLVPASIPAKTPVMLRRKRKPKLGEDENFSENKYHFKNREMEVVGEPPFEAVTITDGDGKRDTVTVPMSEIHRFGTETHDEGEHLVNGFFIESASKGRIVLNFPSDTARQNYLSFFDYRLPKKPQQSLPFGDDSDDDGDAWGGGGSGNPLRPVIFSSPSLAPPPKLQPPTFSNDRDDLLKLVDPRAHPLLDDIVEMKRTKV